MTMLRRDVRFVLRGRRSERFVVLFAIASLGLGIGGNAWVFAFIRSLILDPLPYPDPDRIVLLGQRGKDEPELGILSLISSLGVWADYRERSRTLEGWAAMSPTMLSLSQGDRSVPVLTGRTTPGLFPLLGAQPVRGRLFTDREALEGGPVVALVSWERWQRTGGPERDPLGEILTLDGEPHEVVGVLPPGFEFILPDVEVWTPLRWDPLATPRNLRNVLAAARMRPGVSMGEVEAEVSRIADELEAEHPADFLGWTMDPLNLQNEFPDPQSRLYMGLAQGLVFFVLLVACANVSILLLARGRDRRREIALRTVLGAGRLRLVGQLLRESMLIALAGGAVGIVLAAVGVRLFSGALNAIIMRAWHPHVDAGVIAFTVVVAAACGLLFGLLPAVQASKLDQVEALKEGTPSGRRLGRATSFLVGMEIALAMVAVGSGSVLARAILDWRKGDPGFDPSPLLTVGIEVPEWKYPDVSEGFAVVERVRDRVAGIPRVESAALVTSLPKNLFVSRDTFSVDGRPDAAAILRRAVVLRASPEYADALGLAVLEGRFISASDRVDAAPVAVVSQAMAERRFPDRSPLGERVTVRGASREVIGVVGNVQQALAPPPGGGEETIYLPLAQSRTLEPYLVVRTTGRPMALAEAARTEIGGVDPDITIESIETMEDFASRYLVGFEAFNTVFLALAILALLLAGLGTYGIVAYSVGQRTHEIGVRVALGARPVDVVGMIARQGIATALVGLAAGAVLLVPVVSLVKTVVTGLSLPAPGVSTLVAVALVLFAVTLVASLVPAGRAARVHPAVVLKAQ